MPLVPTCTLDMLHELRDMVIDDLDDRLDEALSPAGELSADLALDIATQLVSSRRHEEALALLRQARQHEPSDARLSLEVRRVADALLSILLERLGNLDDVPRIVKAVGEGPAARNEVLALVDGIANFGDILETCCLGRLTSCKWLVELVAEGALSAIPHGSSALPGRARPTARRRRITENFLRAVDGAMASSERQQQVPIADQPDVTGVDVRSEGSKRSDGAAADASAESVEPTSVEQPVPAEDVYASLYRQATQAYLRRDYATAIKLFEDCLERRPLDKRVAHNLGKLRERLAGT